MSQRKLLTLVFSLFVLSGIIVISTTSQSENAAAEAEYVGQQTCMTSDCHSSDSHFGELVDSFKNTMHANIHNRPTPENVIIDDWFDRDTILETTDVRVRGDVGGKTMIFLSKRGTEDKYFMRLAVDGMYADTTDWFSIAYNYGGNGWLLRFLVEVDENYFPSPFQYVLPHYKETDNDTGRVVFIDNARWIAYDRTNDAIRIMERGSNEFLNESWDRRCAACHVNGFDVRKELIADTITKWRAEWVGSDGTDSAIKDINIAIGCESCHGPGSLHVNDPENVEIQKSISPQRWDPSGSSRYWTDRKLDLCNQCHNRHSSTKLLHTYQYNDSLNLPYLPGLELKNFVRDTVKDAQYWSDGKTSSAHHQTGQDYWRSAHYKGHTFSNGCFDCHSPHENTKTGDTPLPYQLDRNWYSMKRGEGCLATGCHPTMALTKMVDGEEFNEHTEHLVENSQCVNCHYTKTQTITFNGTLEFSDHSDNVIPPYVTIDYKNTGLTGMPNTCASSCHRNGYGERNRPDAFDAHVAYKLSGMTGTPMRAPDYGIFDIQFNNWKDLADIQLADSLQAGYDRFYGEYTSADWTGNTRGGASRLTSIAPNPVSTLARIAFTLAGSEEISIMIFSADGGQVRRLSGQKGVAGDYVDEWDLEDDFDHSVPNGVYFVRLQGETFSSVMPVVVRR